MLDLVQSLGTMAVLLVLIVWVLSQWRNGKKAVPGNPGIHNYLKEIKDELVKANTRLELVMSRLEDVWEKVGGGPSRR